MCSQEIITSLTNTIRKSAKYRHMSDAVVRQVVVREWEMGQPEKAVVKAAKKKLHQIGGAFFVGKVRYNAWLATLTEAAATGDSLKLQTVCQTIMEHHASTRERTAILDALYPKILAHTGPVKSILDLACGLNPLTIPWMSLDRNTRYYACDIYEDLVLFLGQVMPILGVDGQSFTCDLSQKIPTEAVDLALVMKTLPTLAQQNKGADKRLLSTLQGALHCGVLPCAEFGGPQQANANQLRARFLCAGGGPTRGS